MLRKVRKIGLALIAIFWVLTHVSGIMYDAAGWVHFVYFIVFFAIFMGYGIFMVVLEKITK